MTGDKLCGKLRDFISELRRSLQISFDTDGQPSPASGNNNGEEEKGLPLIQERLYEFRAMRYDSKSSANGALEDNSCNDRVGQRT